MQNTKVKNYRCSKGAFSESPRVQELELIVQVGAGNRRVISVDREVGAVAGETLEIDICGFRSYIFDS